MASDGKALTGLWFDGQKYFADSLAAVHERKTMPVFEQATRWLDIYFSGRAPCFTPPIRMRTTAFRKAVWQILLTIPFGQTMTYGEIAEKIAKQKEIGRMSAQAVGSAVAHNAISLIIPCHRVIGSDGKLTGYAGGLEKKEWLLAMEKEAGEKAGEREKRMRGQRKMIRRAEKKDADRLNELLFQVQQIHAKGRPDIFKIGARKYTREELDGILADDNRPIFVYEEGGTVKGYVFCIFQETRETNQLHPRKTLYIDDLCVDQAERGKQIGRELYQYACSVAAENDCDSITLNVWELNGSARAFYEKMGLEPLKTTMEKRLNQP